MNRAAWAGVAAIIAVATGAFVTSAGLRPNATAHLASTAHATEGGSTIYYQHPDGKPLYSLKPTKAPD